MPSKLPISCPRLVAIARALTKTHLSRALLARLPAVISFLRSFSQAYRWAESVFFASIRHLRRSFISSSKSQVKQTPLKSMSKGYFACLHWGHTQLFSTLVISPPTKKGPRAFGKTQRLLAGRTPPDLDFRAPLLVPVLLGIRLDVPFYHPETVLSTTNASKPVPRASHRGTRYHSQIKESLWAIH